MILDKLSYDKESGFFTSKLSNKRIGYLDGCGYEVVNIYKQEYRSHRLAMVVMGLDLTGCEVDHVNGVRSDNKFSNLRLVSKKENAKNKRLRVNNKTGVHGVTFIKASKKWRSRISDGLKRSLHLGCFDNLFDSVCARKSAEIRYGYHENNGSKFG